VAVGLVRPVSRVFSSNRAGTACSPRTSASTSGAGEEKGSVMEFLLWLIAVVLVIAGIVAAVRGAVLYGIVLIIIGLLVGPGGVSIFT